MNQQNPQAILHHILEIVEFKDDKDQTANEFILLCQQQTLSQLIDALPYETKQTLKLIMEETKNNPDHVKSVLKDYISPEQYNEELERVTKKAFDQFIQNLSPTLSNEQKDKLGHYLQSLSSGMSTSNKT